MTSDYWPWWVGGPLLAGVAILFPLLTRTPLGVSGAVYRLFRGPSKVGGADPAGAAVQPSVADSAPASLECGQGVVGSDGEQVTLARGSNLAFLLSTVAGGAVAGWVSGRPWGAVGYSPDFHRLFGSGLASWLVLFAGGVLVGFGTRLSGGCTSGHGLSGCGRLQVPSLLATAVFFGVAIGVSFLLESIKA